MTDVIISIAHSPYATDQAQSGPYIEYIMSLVWSTFVAQELKHKGISYLVIDVANKTTKANTINANNYKLAIEIHFNSFKDETVRGAETLYDPDSKLGLIYAEIMQNQLTHLPNRDRGIKPGWYRGEEPTRISFLHDTKPPALIIEPDFISAREELITMAPLGVALIGNAIREIVEFKQSIDGLELVQ